MSDVQASETAAWNLIVPAGATARLNADGRCSLTGTLTGAGAFTYYTGYVRTNLAGNWAAFSGQILAVTDRGGGDFRITNTAGFPNAALDLGDQVYAYYNTSPPSTLSIGGTITNSGNVCLYGTTALSSAGTFTNNGILDLINGPQTLPANFVNTGTVLTASGVRVQSLTRAGADFTLTIQSHPGHTYQGQRRDTLTAGAWTDLGPAQTGTDSVITFTHIGGATGPQRYYRISVAP